MAGRIAGFRYAKMPSLNRPRPPRAAWNGSSDDIKIKPEGRGEEATPDATRSTPKQEGGGKEEAMSFLDMRATPPCPRATPDATRSAPKQEGGGEEEATPFLDMRANPPRQRAAPDSAQFTAFDGGGGSSPRHSNSVKFEAVGSDPGGGGDAARGSTRDGVARQLWAHEKEINDNMNVTIGREMEKQRSRADEVSSRSGAHGEDSCDEASGDDASGDNESGDNASGDEESGDEESGDEESSDDDNDILLSLHDEKYKEKITSSWEILWGESRRSDVPTPKDMAHTILDDLKAEMASSGGAIYRKSKGNSRVWATNEVALSKIRNDLTRGKQDYRKSIFYKWRKEPDATDSEGEGGDDDTEPPSSPIGASKLPASSAAVRDGDLVVSSWDDEYQKFISKLVETFVDGQSKRSLITVASNRVKRVKSAGGSIFRMLRRNQYFEVDDEVAIKKITADVREKLADARKTQACYVVVNKKNERYLDAIAEGAKALAKGNIGKSLASSRAEEISKALLEEFKHSGGKHFFKNAVDEDEIPRGEALEKILKDIQAEARSLPDPPIDDSEGEVDVAPTASPTGPAKLPWSAATVRDSDLVVNLRDNTYKKIIAKIVQTFVDGQSKRPLTAIASDQVKKIRSAGGNIFKSAKRDQHTKVGNQDAINKIIADVRDKLADARKNLARYVVVNKKNERYVDAIMEGATALLKEDISKSSASSRAEQIAQALLGKFRSSGAMHFFKNAVDEYEIPSSEAQEKILKDIQVEAQSAHSPIKSSSINGGSNEGILSSTRTHPKLKKATIHTTPREYMSCYVRDLICRHPEWTLKRKTINSLDTWVASCQRSGAPCKLVGLDEILDDAYLSGFYEAHVVEEDEGREILELAGILDDPDSIFSDELRRERKRRTHAKEQTKPIRHVLLQMPMNMGFKNNDGSHSPTRQVETLESETQSCNLSAADSEVNNGAEAALRRCNDARKAQVGGKHSKRKFSEHHEGGLSESNNMKKHGHGGNKEIEQENHKQEGENEGQRGVNKDTKQGSLTRQPAAALSTSSITGSVPNESRQDHRRQEMNAARASAQRSEEVSNNPVVLLDPDDPMLESEPVTIKDEEAGPSDAKTKASDFGDSRAEIREKFKGILQGYNGAKTDHDAAGIEFFGHLKQFLELKARSQEFNLGHDAKIITQAVECFKNDMAEIKANPSEPFFEGLLAATIAEAKEKLPLR